MNFALLYNSNVLAKYIFAVPSLQNGMPATILFLLFYFHDSLNVVFYYPEIQMNY